ncbi:MAG: acyltransferase [Succinivibrio sp.]|nr:acyltransferase [Succinivibrio sp.]
MQNSKRNKQDDLIRVVAMLFVIMVHSVVILKNQFEISFIYALCFSCNSIFFMLSGKYNLRFKVANEDSILSCCGGGIVSFLTYYKKKFINIFLPFFICSLLIYLTSYNSPDFSIYNFFYKFFSNNIQGHLWFVYTLTGIMLISPFLSCMLQNLSNNGLILFVLIGLLWKLITIILFYDILKISFAFFDFAFNSWIFVFILGYVCDRITTTKKTVFTFIIIGVICFIVTLYQSIFLNSSAYLYDFSPFYILFALGMYLLLGKVILIKNEYVNYVISIISKHSYTIYLVHYCVLNYVLNVDIFKSYFTNCTAQYILNVTLTFFGAFALAVFLDNIIIKNIKNCFEILLSKGILFMTNKRSHGLHTK